MTQTFTLDCSIYQSNEEVLNTISHLFLIDPFEKSNYRTSWIKRSLLNGNLIIRAQNVQKIPSTIFCLKNVQQFIVDSSSFEHPDDFAENVLRFSETLSTLSIANTIIGQLNENFGRMVHLEILNLINAGLRWVPSSIRYLQAITTIDLTGNNLTVLPMDLRLLKKLQSFTVSNNRHLTSLKPLNHHPSLEHLKADGCAISEIPKYIPNLFILNLANNKIENLYGIETIGFNISQPKEFYLSNNRIRTIPLGIVQVSNLSRLIIDGNRLRNILRHLLEVKTLRCISFRNNQINQGEFNRTIKEFSDRFNSSIFC